jgi:hypothetical protein
MRKPIRPFVVEVKGSKRASKLDDFWKLADQPAAVPADKAVQTANSLFKKAPEENRALASAETHAGRSGAPARSGRILMDLAYKPPVEPVLAEPEPAAAEPLFDPPLKRRPGRPRKVLTDAAPAAARPAAEPPASSRAASRAARTTPQERFDGAPKTAEAAAPRAGAGRPQPKTMATWMLEPDEPLAPVAARPAPVRAEPAVEDPADAGRTRRAAVPSRAEKWKRRLPKVLR